MCVCADPCVEITPFSVELPSRNPPEQRVIRIEFLTTAGKDGGSQHMKSAPVLPITPSPSSLCPEVAHWRARPDGSNVKPEYLRSLAGVCVVPEIMAASSVGDKAAQLLSLPTELQCRTPAQRDQLFCSVIAKAFDVSAARAATFRAGVHVADSNGHNLEACFFAELRKFADALTWERPVLDVALRLLIDQEDADGLKIVLGLVVRAARECAARKRHTFCTIVSRVRIPTAGTLSGDSAATVPGAAAAAPPDAVDAVTAAASRLRALAAEFIGDLKDRAVASTFTEPIAMYCERNGDGAVALDLDVHGVSTFLALLEATTGTTVNAATHTVHAEV